MKHVFLEFIDNINSYLISYLPLGETIVTNDLKTSEAYIVCGVVLALETVANYGSALYIFSFWDWLKEQLLF